MVSSAAIGRRIRELRKQKHISQEKMADDLGMYQADVSNIERDMGGSGINDIFKLDMIAQYLGVSLLDLLGVSEAAPSSLASILKKQEPVSMRDYTIVDVQYDESDEFNLIVSELKLLSPKGKAIYVAFAELEDEPSFYKSRKTILPDLLNNRYADSHEQKLLKLRFLSGDDYVDIFRDVKPAWKEICRYLIYVATDLQESVQKFIADTKGKTFAEITVPASFREPDNLPDLEFENLSVVYRYRLSLETSLKHPTVFDDMDSTIAKQEKILLKKLKAACQSEEAYQVWKKDIVDARAKEIQATRNIIVVDYLFVGIGRYQAIMPEEAYPCFREFIDGNGSAFCTEGEPAGMKEIRIFAAEHIADELYKEK